MLTQKSIYLHSALTTLSLQVYKLEWSLPKVHGHLDFYHIYLEPQNFNVQIIIELTVLYESQYLNFKFLANHLKHDHSRSCTCLHVLYIFEILPIASYQMTKSLLVLNVGNVKKGRIEIA